MILSKNKIFEYLGNISKLSDPESSSHWNHYHSNFEFRDNKFHGLIGFGENKKPFKGLTKFIHFLLQTPFRRIGKKFSKFNDIYKIAIKIRAKQKVAFDLDMLRQVISLSYFYQKLKKNISIPNNLTCIIGDGFGSLTTLMLSSNFSKKIILVNLSKTLLVDLWYIKLWMGLEKFNKSVLLLNDNEEISEKDIIKMASSDEIKIIAIEAKNHHLIKKFKIDFFVNIVSMQEMNNESINSYFEDFRQSLNQEKVFFYCCNRLIKELPDGTVTNFLKYPWNKEDIFLIDELCPWHNYFYYKYPPFYKKYDGPVQHRLVRLK